jgi:hypothetical protein
MDFELLIPKMGSNAKTINSLAGGVSNEQARWRPDSESWSLLEVIHHLYDEEKQDFRVRLKIILSQSNADLPPIDPQGWVTERAYNDKDLTRVLSGFLHEREQSISWLKGLQSPDWTAVYQNPWGEISAGDMFASWVAHDLLHIRQLVELHWAYTNQLVSPYSVDYAGPW